MGTYIVQGIPHILFGADHMLFVLGLLLTVKDRWMLPKTVTAFIVAHSITLDIATLRYANIPVVPLNAAIAVSILFLGPEILPSWRGETSFSRVLSWPDCAALLIDAALYLYFLSRGCSGDSPDSAP